MARKTVRQQKDESSAQLEKRVEENTTKAENAVERIDNITETTRPEDGLYMSNGQPVMTDDNKPYTLQMLNDLEEKASGQPVNDGSQPTIEELNRHAENLTRDMRELMSDRDMWKQRAQDAETKNARFKEGIPVDSMGIPKVVD